MEIVVYAILFVCVTLTPVMGNPVGCTYYSSLKEYRCSARSWSLPLVYSAFSNVVQVLKLTDVNGDLPNAAPLGPTFSGFDTIDTTGFDGNIVPQLQIKCAAGGSLIVSNGTFADMGWVKEVRFIDCLILTLPDDVFRSFGTLNYLGIEGGSVSNMGFNCFNGLNLERMADVPEPSGTLSIRNSQLTSGGLPNGVLYPLTNVSVILIENAHMRVVQKDMFQASTKATYISLKNNPFSYVTSGLFDNTDALTTVEFTGIDWACTCTNLWVYRYLVANNITLKGDIVCGGPTAYANVKGSLYDKEKCDDSTPCGDDTGIVIGTYCYLVADIVFHGMLLITFAIAITAFAMMIHHKRQTAAKQAGGDGNRRPGLGKRKASGSQWKKVGGESMA